MFDIGWSELVVIGVVALIAIGPKELPGVLRMVGQWMGKVRRMASEFQGQFNDAMREAELDEIRKQVEDVNQSVAGFNPMQTARDELKGAIDGPAAPSDAAAVAGPNPLVPPTEPATPSLPTPEPAAVAAGPLPAAEPEHAAPAPDRAGEGRA